MPGSTARRSAAPFFAPIPVAAVLVVATSAAFAAPSLAPGLAPGLAALVQRAAQWTAIIVGAALGAIVLHDAAHWLAARALGFRTVEVTIGPFIFAPSRRGLLVRAMRSWSALTGGLLVEPRSERRVNARRALMAAAGPAVSLAVGVAALDAAPVLAIASLLRFVLAAVPLGVRGQPTDGGQLLLLAAGGAPADRFVALQRIAAAQRIGTRPRAWPERWVADAIALHDGTTAEALACAAAVRRALDGCAHDRAAALLERALALRALLPRAAACALLADAAYFEARIHDDVERAQRWLDEAEARRPACPVAEQRAAAAVLLASGDFAAGAAVAREALAQLERLERVEHRSLPMESDWLREMLARAECASVLPVELLAAG